MAASNESWVLMLTARSPTNIAVIKYWGKRDEALILPVNDSISLTLDPDHLCTTTTVAVSPAFKSDRMWLNGKEISLCGDRYQSCLREIRMRAGDVEDKERGVHIQKEDWERLHVHIASYNNFPTAAGLASSAAGLACLVFALAKLMNVTVDNGELSSIARFFAECIMYSVFYGELSVLELSILKSFLWHHRQGSGSACRSLYGGFVKWVMGNDGSGRDSIAVQLASETHWDDLVIIIAVVSSQQKETSSTAGMRESVQTSSLLHYRAKEVVPKRILQMEEAIRKLDFATFAALTCADSNQFHAVCLDTCPPIFYLNETSCRIISYMERWNRFEGVHNVAYTFDAGPNAVIVARDRKTAGHLLRRLLFYFPPENDLNSYILGDKSMLQEAGIQGMNDVEALQPPPEIKDNALAGRHAGDVSYFICTRIGGGPTVLTAKDQGLIDPITGMPKLSVSID